MDRFAIGRFSQNGGRAFAGLMRSDKVWALSSLPGFEHVTETLQLFECWTEQSDSLASAAASAAEMQALDLAELRVEAPIVPRQIFCTGANYRKHVIQLRLKQPSPSMMAMTQQEREESAARMMDERALHGAPYAFVKLPSAVTGPYDEIIIPRGAREPDWELELGVVIGRPTRHVGRAEALSCVAGYVVVNDITVRERIYREDLKAIGTDWLASKNAATFLPMGPWIIPARFVGDPQDLQITFKLNGEIMQDESTSDMIFDVARQIEYISSLVTLLPGDVICTGSPAGNGTHHGRFLTPGDIAEGTISGLGTQRLTCVAED